MQPDSLISCFEVALLQRSSQHSSKRDGSPAKRPGTRTCVVVRDVDVDVVVDVVTVSVVIVVRYYNNNRYNNNNNVQYPVSWNIAEQQNYYSETPVAEKAS